MTLSRAVWLAVLVTFVARADVIPSSEAECRGKKKGDVCRADTGKGVCADATCSRKDYSGGIPPKSRSVPCLKCAPPEAPDAGVAGK